jgi:hypothetical protein
MKNRLLFVLSLLLLSPAAFAQIGSSEVLGTVHDPNGAIVSGATVTLKNLDTGIETKATTNESGAYDFLEVKVGRYSVTILMNGFETFTASDVLVDVSARQRVDATLKLGATTQTIEVKGAAAVLDTDTSDH